MRGLTNEGPSESVNPYIALADSTLNLVLLLVLFIATVLLAILQREDTHISNRDLFEQAIAQAIPENYRPTPYESWKKNDPPGTQRWVFEGQLLFKKGTANLTPKGREVLGEFVNVLARNGDMWRRVRIEGHTTRTPKGQQDDWSLATNRAATVARLLTGHRCKISANYIATSGRGGQDYLSAYPRTDPHQERVEIILEYATQTSKSQSCS